MTKTLWQYLHKTLLVPYITSKAEHRLPIINNHATVCTGQVTSSIAVQGNTHIYIYYTKRLTQNHIHVFGISNIYIKRKSKDIETAGI